MDYQELIERLRDTNRHTFALWFEAADAIESLLAENERLKAEIAKYRDAPVVAYATTNEEDDLTMLFFDEDEARKYSGDDEPIKLYTIPPTAEQIANETAEACAKYIDSTNGNIRGVNTVFSKALRSGAWKDFKK